MEGGRETGRDKDTDREKQEGTEIRHTHTHTQTDKCREQRQTCQAIPSPAPQKTHRPHFLPPAGWTALGPVRAVRGTSTRGRRPRTVLPTGAGPSLTGGADGGG